jgi:hypothetical protein
MKSCRDHLAKLRHFITEERIGKNNDQQILSTK